MTAFSLFLIFVLAKLCVLWASAAPITGWSAIAYVWQDALVALAFSTIQILLRRIARIIYAAIAIYAAINIPVGRALSTPLTRPMLRAARGPLIDSMREYVTATNVGLVLTILALAAALPWVLRRAPPQLSKWIAAGGMALVLAGPAAGRRAETHGMDRNVVLALAGAGLPRTDAVSLGTDWRASRYAAGPADDLSRLAGAGRGLNFVMVGLESTAAEYLALYGGAYDVMPNLSRLAKRALVFDNAYAVYPESIKGLFSVLCSIYPAFDTRPDEYANSDCHSVASVAGDAGYRTALFHSGRFAYLGMQSIVRGRGYQTLEDAGDIGGNYQSSFGVDEPSTVARMLDWIDAAPRGQPFFLTYLPIAGHHPYATPAYANPKRGPFAGGAEIDPYRNALHYGDESLGALMDGLRARGLEQNTVWVIYGDHGEAFHQHPGNYGHTFFLYDENVHVPFLIVVPGLGTERRVRKVVSLVDTAPTILDLMGIQPPDNYQGRSMLSGAPRMALFFTDYSLGLLGLRDGRWKFIYETGSGKTELFDVQSDPSELENISSREASRTAWYAQLVRGWSSAQQSYVAGARP